VRLDLACPNVSFHEVALLDYPLLAHRSYALALTAKMIEVARGERLDLFHLHYAVPHAVSAYLARQVMGHDAPKVLTTLHGTDVTLVGINHGFAPLTRFAVASSDGITVPSRWLAEAAHVTLGLPRELAVQVIPNFVDTRRFHPNRALPGKVAGSGANVRVLTHVSNFRPLKRVEDVVKIFSIVRREFSSRLDLVGDGPERSRIEALVRTLGLQADVSFRGELDDIVDLYQHSDVFLLPSETESFGLAALEAMACGVPVVASDVGGVSEVVADGETGLLAAVGDVTTMAGHVCRLFGDDHLYLRASQAARERVERDFSLEPAIDRYEAAYRRIL
jgi:N-acetyl-alpha-D-glucosaminyl L-malate synthase BshA